MLCVATLSLIAAFLSSVNWHNVTMQALVAQMSDAADAVLDEKGKRVAELRDLSRPAL